MKLTYAQTLNDAADIWHLARPAAVESVGCLCHAHLFMNRDRKSLIKIYGAGKRISAHKVQDLHKYRRENVSCLDAYFNI